MARISICMALPFLSLASACGQLQPELSDKQMQALREAFSGMTKACLDKLRYEGSAANLPNRVDRCFAMAPMRRWEGIWYDDFEGQTFCPGDGKACPGLGIWLSFGNAANPVDDRPGGRAYRIAFVGRRTALPGHHGHMGAFTHEIIVDRLVSISPIEPRIETRIFEDY